MKRHQRQKSSPSFAHLWNSFQASYFSGVLLINGDLLREKVCTFFQADTCDPARLAAIIDFFQVTPEMLFHRLTEILPRFFNIEHVHFLRFDCEKEPRERFLLTKYLNMASLPILYDDELREHYCRRWMAIQILRGAPPSPTKRRSLPPSFGPDARAPAAVRGMALFLRRALRLFRTSEADQHHDRV